MATVVSSKCTYNMQLAAFYYILIATYFMAGSPASSASDTPEPLQHSILHQQQQHKQKQQPNIQSSHPRERMRDPTKDFLYDPVLHSPSDENILVSNNAQDLSHLEFRPSVLRFGELAVGDVNSEVVTVFNRHPNRSVYLGSISGSAVEFYSSFFEDKVIEPMANTTFNVVFLPRHPKVIISALQIHTSFGVSQYVIQGSSIKCPFRIHPLVGLRAPFNATLTPEINIYNPYAVPMQILEVFSSGSQFQLELPNSDPEAPSGIWEVPAFGTRTIIRVRFRASTPGHHKAFIRIMVAAELADVKEIELVFPIEVEITDYQGVYAEHPFLHFGKGGYSDPPKKIVFKLLNSGHEPVSIHSFVVEGDDDLAKAVSLRVNSRDYHKGTGDEDLTKIHMISATLDWAKLKMHRHILGHISIRTLLSNQKIAEHRIPIVGEVIPGSIFFHENQTQFATTGKLAKSSKGFTLRNDFEEALAITNVSLPDDTAKYFKITPFDAVVLLPGEEALLFRITQLLTAAKRPITRSIWLHTNASSYEIPLSSYNGLLRRIVPVDETTQDGVGTDEETINYGTLSLSTVTDTVVAFVNDGPRPVTIHNWTATISEAASIFVILRGCGPLTMNNLKFCYSIQPHEWMLFQVSVLSNAIGSFAGRLVLQTDYEELVTPVRFNTAVGRLQFSATMLEENRCFPGGLCSVNLTAFSTFAQPMVVKEILVNVTGITYDYSNSDFPSIVPNELTHIGQLQFSPKPVCGEECYLEFPDRWAPSVISNNCKNHEHDMMHSKLEAFRGMRSSFSSIFFRVQTNHVRRYDFNGSASIIWPKLVATGSAVEFPTYQVGEQVLKTIDVTNPTDQPIKVYYMLHDVARHGSAMTYPPEIMTLCWDCFLSREGVFSLVDMDDAKHSGLQIVPPRSTAQLTVRFYTLKPGSYSNLLYIRNNFTILEALWLTANAVAHQFKFGNRRPGSDTALMFDLSDKHYRDCKRSAEHLDAPPVLVTAKRTFTAKNTGDVPIDVFNMYIEGKRCEGFGFRILNCWGFRLQPDSSEKIEIVFTPDFTLARIDRILSFETSLHYAINYTLASQVPSAALHTCGKALIRPPWEYQLRCIAFIMLSTTFFLVILAAFFESDKLLKDHVNNMSRDKGPMEPTLDLRHIGMRSPLFEDFKSTSLPAILPSKSNSKSFSYLRRRGANKRGETETAAAPKSWANALVRKFSPIQTDVKFRDKTPPPPSVSKKEPPHKRLLLKEVVALMDAGNGKSGEEDTSSSTTDSSSLSNDRHTKKSPVINRKKSVQSNVQITTPPVVSVTPTNPNGSLANAESATTLKSKAKTVVKKTKSLPAQPVFKETVPDSPQVIANAPPPPNPAPPTKPVKLCAQARVTNGGRAAHNGKDKDEKRAVSDPIVTITSQPQPKDAKEPAINIKTSDPVDATLARKYGKTPGRERRKEVPAIPVTRKLNLSKMPDKPLKGPTAFSFTSPLSISTPPSATTMHVVSLSPTEVPPANVWDMNKTSFSNIVAQNPSVETSISNQSQTQSDSFSSANGSQSLSTIDLPISSTPKPIAPSTDFAYDNSSAAMPFPMPSTKFSRLTGKPLFEDYAKLKDVRDFAGRSCDQFLPNNSERLAMEMLDDPCADILPSHMKNAVDLGPIGTRKSPSNTPVWEPMASVHKPIAVTPSVSGNPNSFFSENFSPYSNSFVGPISAAGQRNETGSSNGDMSGITGMFNNAFGQNVAAEKSRFWDPTMLINLLQQTQLNNHQQINLPPMESAEASIYANPPNHFYGLNNPINPPQYGHSSSTQQQQQHPSMFSDLTTLWGNNYGSAPVPTSTWNAPPSGPIRAPPGLERQTIPNRLYNQQQQALETDTHRSNHHTRNSNTNNNINHNNNGHSSLSLMSQIWSHDSWTNLTGSASSNQTDNQSSNNNNNNHAHSTGFSNERNNPSM